MLLSPPLASYLHNYSVGMGGGGDGVEFVILVKWFSWWYHTVH